LAKQIRIAALQNCEKAWLFARRGKQFSGIEEILHDYFGFYDQQQDFLAGRQSKWIKWLAAYRDIKHHGKPFPPGFDTDLQSIRY
jgi:hypothetical protein